ncbi:AMP-binding protein [Spirosoma pollinicola]|uniref:4-coumarate--CoA ligase n=1 Tax=Spirosoma pollinicola TaxID=2057025 RepID=A0A2K8Z098_9BACT|nr:AMP-binding protein [Spirosoma pollinicola]AUD03320.1 4-coumarate--CoA ligase [Spirosoma pollinicola]
MIWTPDNVKRIVLDMAGRIRQQPHAGLPSTVSPSLDLYYDLGMDSLQRMELAACLNEFFGLLDGSSENYLLAGTTLEHWVNCILRARQQSDDWLTFRTSGSTGVAKPVRHSMVSLLAEAQFLSQLLPRPRQVVSLVAANHIYGFIYTILLPAIWACPLRLLADVKPSDIDSETLLIGTPFTWEFLHRSLTAGTRLGCRGVTSTAPMPPGLFARLTESGVGLTEIYGSSDTGGLAWRCQPDAPFTLFSFLNLLPGDPPTVIRTDTGESFLLPDRVDRVSLREIRVLGRLDNAVQIAGVNVYPAHIRQVIEGCPLVAECDVYAKADAGVSQLYGAIRLRTLNDPNREACLRWIREHLTAPETPKHLYLY